MKPSEPKKPSISGVRRGALAAVLVAAVAAVVVWAVRSRSNPPPAPGTSRGANVLLVTIDTLRRDRVGAYAGIGGQTRGRIGGQTPDLTPTLDKLAGRGMRFDAAFSHAPMTLPAHTSILTGLIPRRHGVRNNTGFRLDDRIPTLGTAMKSAGYRTGAFVSAFVLDARFGLSRGFDVYDDHLPRTDRASFHVAERPADDVVQAAGDWILSTPSALSPQPSSPQPSSPQPSSPQPSSPQP